LLVVDGNKPICGKNRQSAYDSPAQADTGGSHQFTLTHTHTYTRKVEIC